jgi:hypothetical protein
MSPDASRRARWLLAVDAVTCPNDARSVAVRLPPVKQAAKHSSARPVGERAGDLGEAAVRSCCIHRSMLIEASMHVSLYVVVGMTNAVDRSRAR